MLPRLAILDHLKARWPIIIFCKTCESGLTGLAMHSTFPNTLATLENHVGSGFGGTNLLSTWKPCFCEKTPVSSNVEIGFFSQRKFLLRKPVVSYCLGTNKPKTESNKFSRVPLMWQNKVRCSRHIRNRQRMLTPPVVKIKAYAIVDRHPTS